MKIIETIIRYPLPDQFKALLEKLETQDIDARSLRNIGNLLADLKLTRYERWVIGRVYKRIRRLNDLNRVMQEVILGEQRTMSDYDIARDVGAKVQAAVAKGTLSAQQRADWNDPRGLYGQYGANTQVKGAVQQPVAHRLHP